MEISDGVARALVILAVILLVISGIIIIDKGIPALSEGYLGSDSVMRNALISDPAAVQGQQAPAPGNNAGNAAGNGNNAAVANVPVSTLSPDNRALFDQSNGFSGSPDSVQFTFDGTGSLVIDVQGQRMRGDLKLSGKGYGIGGKNPFQFKLDTDGTISDGKQTRRFTLNLMVVNNKLYLKVSSPDNNTQTAWVEYPINDMLKAAGGALNVQVTDPNSGVNRPAFDIASLPSVDFSQISPLLQVLDFSKFIYTQRLPDINQNTAHYSTSVDLLQFLQSPQLSQMITTMSGLVSAIPNANADLNNLNEVAKQAPNIVPRLFKSFNMTFDHIIQIDTRQVSRVGLDLNTTIDLGSLDPTQPVLLTLTVNGALTPQGYNADYPAITPPPPNEIQQPNANGLIIVTPTP